MSHPWVESRGKGVKSGLGGQTPGGLGWSMRPGTDGETLGCPLLGLRRGWGYS